MEAEFIDWLRAFTPGHPELILGIGDDAAVLRPAGPGGIVVTSDMLTDGVDFILSACRAAAVGAEGGGRESQRSGGDGLSALGDHRLAWLCRVWEPRSWRASCTAGSSSGGRVRRRVGGWRHKHLGRPARHQRHRLGAVHGTRSVAARWGAAG